MAAIPLSNNNRFLALTKNSKYISYKKNIDKYWNLERKNYIAKVIPWREKNIEDIQAQGGSLDTEYAQKLSNLKFETVIYNDKNRHQVNLYKCCTEPEKFAMISALIKR